MPATHIKITPSDEELVLAFQGGDIAAFDVLVARWDHKIQGAIYRVVGSDEDARDLAQEAFLKAYRALGSFRREARFSSWLYQIALNLCRDRLRRRRGKTFVSLDETGVAERSRSPDPSVHQQLEARDLARIVTREIEDLAAEQREAIVLKEYQGLTFAEIADVLDVPLSTVKTRLYRGLNQLRRGLERRGVEPRPSGAGRES